MKNRAEWTAWADNRKRRLEAAPRATETAQNQAVAPPASATASELRYPLLLLCRAHGLPEPIPECHFDPDRGWRFDYGFIPWKIAVEIEGGIWRKGGGAHSHPLNIERDHQKYTRAAVLGWRILHYPPERLSSAIDDLREVLK